MNESDLKQAADDESIRRGIADVEAGLTQPLEEALAELKSEKMAKSSNGVGFGRVEQLPGENGN